MLISTTFVSAAAKRKIAGTPLDKYTIVYSPTAEAEEGKNVACDLQKNIKDVLGKELLVATSDKVKKSSQTILFTHSKDIKVFDYVITVGKKGVIIDGGSSWSMQQALKVFSKELFKKDLPSNYHLKGNIEGQILFPRRSDVNLRILDDNIWDYSSEKFPEAWKKLGVDPRDDNRAPQFAQLVRAYMPDIVALQEYSTHMHNRFYPRIQKYGYTIAYEGEGPWNNTPIFYNKDNIELIKVNYVLYSPSRWSNIGSKSFTSVVLKHKATGKIFALINTHLWWMGESRQAGSTNARAAQVRLMMAEADVLKDEYDCPLFVTGDMNCYENTIPMQQFFQGGYEPCYKIATVYKDTNNGHHICSAPLGFSRKSNRPSPNRAEGALDHCLLYNGKNRVEIKIFDCIQAEFTVKLTDHYPNLIDAQLK